MVPRPAAEGVLPESPTSGRAGARRRTLMRKLHAVVGLVASLNLLFILVTGFLLQHREGFRLEDRLVSRAILPEGYRPQDGAGGVRADIVVTDLHSGRMLGTTGTLVLDGITLGWFVLLLSGVYLFFGGGGRQENGLRGNGDS